MARLPSPMPQSANVTSATLNIAHPSSAPPILTTPSSTIPAADTAMPTTGKINFPQSQHQFLIGIKLQALRLGRPRRERLSAHSKLLLSPLVCIHPKPLLFIINDSDIGLLSSYPSTSPLIASVTDAGLMSVDTEMTVACEIQPACIKLTLSLINSDLAVDQAKGPLQKAVPYLQQPAPGLSSLQIYLLSF